MTIIEVLVVVIIVAVAATGVSYAFGALDRTQLRSACMHLSAAARYAYNRAIAQGTTTRLSLDLDNGTVAIEEAHGRVVLARATDPMREDAEHENESGNDISGVDPWKAAQARLENTLHVSFGGSPFSPIEGRRFAAQSLGSGIRIDRLITPHEPDPRRRGQGSIYFFSSGQTEHAVIWLSDARRPDQVFSVEIHPLTGRTRIRDNAFEPDILLDQGADRPTNEVRD